MSSIKEYDLDDVSFSKRIHESWVLVTKQYLTETIISKNIKLKSDDLGIEKFRVLKNGIGEIFVKIKNQELKLRVPKDEYEVN